MFQLHRTGNSNSTVLHKRRVGHTRSPRQNSYRPGTARAQAAMFSAQSSSHCRLLSQTSSLHGCKMTAVQVLCPKASSLAHVSRNEGTAPDPLSAFLQIPVGQDSHVSMLQPIASKEMGQPWLAETPGAGARSPDCMANQRR